MADTLPPSTGTEETTKKFHGFSKGLPKDVDVKYNEGSNEFLPASGQFDSVNRTITNSQEMVCPNQEEAPPFQTNLFSFDDADYSDYHFGLIRGYHREMYEERPQEQWFLCCSLDRETANRIRRRNRALSWQIMGILFGAVFVFFGVAALAISFVVSSDETKQYFWQSLDVPSLYIHIIAIAGLTVLTLGSALISLCLLVPIAIARIHGQDMQGFWCTTGDLYIKNAEKTYNLAPNQFLYFDAAVYGNFVGNPDVKNVQPTLTN